MSYKKHYFIYFVVLCCNFFSSTFASSHFISFIMPCYNCAKTMQEAIDSIYQQNVTVPFEVVCTDDGSTDATRSILLDYQKKHSNLHVYVHETNKGGSAARNTCVKHSKGDLIFCLDSDNVLEANSVMPLITLLDSSGCQAAAFEEVRYFRENFASTKSWFHKAPHNRCDIHHILQTNQTPGSSGNYLYTRASYDRAKGYPERNHGAMDAWCFAFRQHATGTVIAILPHSFYWHRLTENGFWWKEEQTGRNNLNCWAVVNEFPELFTPETQQLLKAANPHTHNFFNELNAGRFKLRKK